MMLIDLVNQAGNFFTVEYYIISAIPIAITVIVFFSKKQRQLTLTNIYNALVATFGIVLLLAATGRLIGYAASAITAMIHVSPSNPSADMRYYDTVNMIFTALAFIAIIAAFVLSIRGARKRGEW